MGFHPTKINLGSWNYYVDKLLLFYYFRIAVNLPLGTLQGNEVGPVL